MRRILADADDTPGSASTRDHQIHWTAQSQTRSDGVKSARYHPSGPYSCLGPPRISEWWCRFADRLSPIELSLDNVQIKRMMSACGCRARTAAPKRNTT